MRQAEKILLWLAAAIHADHAGVINGMHIVGIILATLRRRYPRLASSGLVGFWVSDINNHH